VTQTDILIECTNCGRPGHEAEAEEAGWRYRSDGIDLHPICALCSYLGSLHTAGSDPSGHAA